MGCINSITQNGIIDKGMGDIGGIDGKWVYTDRLGYYDKIL